jgi:hypothetical protein
MKGHFPFVVKWSRKWSAGLTLAILIGSSNALMAAGDSAGHLTYMVTPHGGVDWTTGVATATGIGVPPKVSASALQAKEMTRTAAWSVALRNLLEVVNGLYVDSTTTVNNFVTSNDDVRARVEGMVQGAKLVQERQLPSGEFETTVEMKLGGPFSDLMLPKSPQKSEPLKRLELNAPSQVMNPTKKNKYTGVVIDARGTGAKPALAPRVLTAQGEEAYSVAYVNKTQTALDTSDDKNRIAWYVTSEDAAKTHVRVATNPLMVKAIRAEGANSTDLVIHDADAQLIQLLPENFIFLKQAKVLVILDPM